MRLPRAQLFEWNDLPWVPASVRDSIVESLGRSLAWGGILRGLVGPFSEFLRRSGATEVLDLCCGAGAPAVLLADALRRAGHAPPRFVLTDLYPRPTAWARLVAKDPAAIAVHPEPVDATRIPASLAEGRARMVVNALHHFPPDAARAMFEDAIRHRAPVFVSECFDRNPLRFLSFAPVGLPALFANPILSPDDRWQKALWTWLTPAMLAASIWDGVVSTLRVYEEPDLREMTRAAGPDWEWHYGRFPWSPGGLGTYFWGAPRQRE